MSWTIPPPPLPFSTQICALIESHDLLGQTHGITSYKLCFGFYIKIPKIFENSTELTPERANKNIEVHLVEAVDEYEETRRKRQKGQIAHVK